MYAKWAGESIGHRTSGCAFTDRDEGRECVRAFKKDSLRFRGGRYFGAPSFFLAQTFENERNWESESNTDLMSVRIGETAGEGFCKKAS